MYFRVVVKTKIMLVTVLCIQMWVPFIRRCSWKKMHLVSKFAPTSKFSHSVISLFCLHNGIIEWCKSGRSTIRISRILTGSLWAQWKEYHHHPQDRMSWYLGTWATYITSFHAILRHFKFNFEAFSISILLAN